MTYSEFKEFLEENSSGYSTFKGKAYEYQETKNRARSPRKRWTEKKLNRAVNEMWKQISQNAYDQIKSLKKSSKTESWEEFFNEINFIESFDDGIAELEFE